MEDSADARRLLELGADPARLSVLGNIKFDMAVPEDLASTGRRGEESTIRQAVWPIGLTGATDTCTHLPTITYGTYDATGAGGVGSAIPNSCSRASIRLILPTPP